MNEETLTYVESSPSTSTAHAMARVNYLWSAVASEEGIHKLEEAPPVPTIDDAMSIYACYNMYEAMISN